MRLIDADMCPTLFDAEFSGTKSLILNGETHLDNLAEGFTEAHNVIRSMPTIDAVPVVRCKDCIHYGDVGDCEVHPYDGRFNVNYFCADGEKKA